MIGIASASQYLLCGPISVVKLQDGSQEGDKMGGLTSNHISNELLDVL